MHYSGLSYLAEDFRLKAYDFLREAAPMIAPYTVKIIETYRDETAQNFFQARNLSAAKFGQSPHNCCDASGNPASRAFDFAVYNAAGKYITDGNDPMYHRLGRLAVTLGMEWGGDWSQQKEGCNPDYDHIQQAKWKLA